MHVAGALTLAAYVGITSLALALQGRSHIQSEDAELADLAGITRESPLDQMVTVVKGSLQSETGLLIALNWFFSICTATALLTTVIFLDRVSHRESARMAERLMKYIVQKVVFVAALSLGPDPVEIVPWIVWFYAVGFWRVFAGAAQDRLESLAVAPMAHPFMRVRAISLLLAILGQGVASLHALRISFISGLIPWPYALLCAFDAAIILVEVSKGLLAFGAHALEGQWSLSSFLKRYLAPAAAATASPFSTWESWEGKGSFLYHLDLVMDTAVHLLTLSQYLHIWFMNGMKFMLVDLILVLDVRAVVVSLHRRFRAHVSYREATRCLQHAFPDANVQALSSRSGADAVSGGLGFDCSICMETMTTAKQLPCGHHFHLACLRAWLQQSGSESFSCPLCRQPLLAAPAHPPLLPHLTPQPSSHLESLQLLQHDSQGIMSSLGRARQSARLWFLAAAVGLVAAAVQGGEVVVHHSRGSQRRDSLGRRGERLHSRPPTSRRRLSGTWNEAVHGAGDHPSDGSDEGHHTQESDAEGWMYEENTHFNQRRQHRMSEPVAADPAETSQQPASEPWRLDAPETWLGRDAWEAIQSFQSSIIGIGGINFGSAMAGFEHHVAGFEQQVQSLQQAVPHLYISTPFSHCEDIGAPSAPARLMASEPREENVFESILTHSRRYRPPNLPNMPNLPNPELFLPHNLPHLPNPESFRPPYLPHLPNPDPAQAVAAAAAAAAAAQAAAAAAPGVAASAAEATAVAAAEAAAAVAREISSMTGGAWAGWESRQWQPAHAGVVKADTPQKVSSRSRGKSFARET